MEEGILQPNYKLNYNKAREPKWGGDGIKEGNVQGFITSQNILDTPLASIIPDGVP